MPQIRPFQGWRYAVEDTDISNLTAPPYDVLSQQQRDELAAVDSHNVVELELAPGALDLETPDNRYVTSKQVWQQWTQQGVLQQDEDPCIYVLEQRFEVDGQPRCRTSFIVAMKLHAFEEKVVIPHELTLPKALGDRYRLLSTTNVNYSQVLGLYSDPSPAYAQIVQEMKQGQPVATATEADGVQDTLWKVDDLMAIAEFCTILEDKQVFIADGHHRYTVALAWRDECRRLAQQQQQQQDEEARLRAQLMAEAQGQPAQTGDAQEDAAQTDAAQTGDAQPDDAQNQPQALFDPAQTDATNDDGAAQADAAPADTQADHPGPATDWVMVALTNMEDPQLSILAYHRAVKAPGEFDQQEFLNQMGQLFDISDVADDDAQQLLAATQRQAFLVGMAGQPLKLMQLKASVDLDQAITAQHSPAWKQLDVSVLHELVVGPLLNVRADMPETLSRIAYSRDPQTLLDRLQQGTSDVVFLLKPTQLQQLKQVSLAGETMPQKSTFFYPKLPSGFVFRWMD